jgi:hypothetical protein
MAACQKKVELEPENPQFTTQSEIFRFNCDLSYPELNLCAQITWLQGPKLPSDSNQGASFEILFFNANTQQPEPISEFSVSLWSHMLHENDYDSEIVISSDDPNQGLFVVENIKLSCLGADWDVYVEVQNQKAKFVWHQSEYLGR